MKSFASVLLSLTLAAIIASCSAPNTPPALSSNAAAYFYQPDLTQSYTYSQDQSSLTDTVTFQTSLVDPSNPYSSYLQLKNQSVSGSSNVLYYFKSVEASDGSPVCVLANSPTSNGFVALKGNLDLGATWFADTAQNIQAVVVGKYAQYFLPGRQVHYDDVVVVKYTDKTAPAGNYIVRYFARYYGLVSELTISGSNTQVTDLQLLSLQGASNSANPDIHHDRWYDANGRYMANMKPSDGIYK